MYSFNSFNFSFALKTVAVWQVITRAESPFLRRKWNYVQFLKFEGPYDARKYS